MEICEKAASTISSAQIGTPFTMTLIQVSQRLQIINGLSVLQSGMQFIMNIIVIEI